MLKMYTLDNRVDQQLSDTAGTVIFHVTDEQGNSRKVFADTYLDENQVPQGVTASSKRELPLVEGLFRMEIGETTTLDFTLYNKTFSRKKDKTVNQIAHDEVMKMQEESSLLAKAGKIFKFNKKETAEID
ncbi:MAG: hypothetical protein L3J51_01530 [Cocleimonas sp.]|nr:hypothetical protein [Cocleimonas sp.]